MPSFWVLMSLFFLTHCVKAKHETVGSPEVPKDHPVPPRQTMGPVSPPKFAQARKWIKPVFHRSRLLLCKTLWSRFGFSYLSAALDIALRPNTGPLDPPLVHHVQALKIDLTRFEPFAGAHGQDHGPVLGPVVPLLPDTLR